MNTMLVKALSKIIGMNEFKLKRAFKQFYGTTVFNYLKRMRMQRALDLLQNTDHKVLYIAYEVGYQNPGHFARAFRDVYGINPGEVSAASQAQLICMSSSTESAFE